MTSNAPPVEDRLALAQAISNGRRPSIINSDNARVGDGRLEDLVEADESYFVEIRHNLTALDFDGSEATVQAQRAFTEIIVAGYAPVLVASGQDGRRHVFCRKPPAEVRDLLKGCADGYDARHTIRPPLTLHRSRDSRSTLLVPPASGDALARLRGEQRVRPLSPRGRWLLHHADPEGDASVLIFKFAMSAANADWSIEDFVTVVTCPGYAIAALFSKRVAARGEDSALDWLRLYVWPAAVCRVEESPARSRGGAIVEALAAAAWAIARPWSPRTGPTDFSVFMALTNKRARAGVHRFDASQREICELSGISSRATVQGSLRRLQDEGLIQRHAQGASEKAAGLADTWELTVPLTKTPTITAETLEEIYRVIQGDAFRNVIALGKSSVLIYAHLISLGGRTRSSLVAGTGLSTKTVARRLSEMEKMGVVIRQDEEWFPASPDLEHLAELIDVDGRGEAQRLLFAREREIRDISREARRRNRT